MPLKMQIQAMASASQALDLYDVLDCKSVASHIKKVPSFSLSLSLSITRIHTWKKHFLPFTFLFLFSRSFTTKYGNMVFMPLEAEMHGVFLFPFPSVWGKFIPPYLCYYVLENALNFSWFLLGMIGRSLTWDMEVDGNVWWDQILVVFSLILKGLSSTLHWRHSIS